jgi:ubiquinone/menaquinone biosynthesis C-methylase UbiE
MSASVSAFDQYARGAWERFLKDPARARASLDALRGIKVARVLDIGCGAGHELLPFASEGAFAVGLDVAPEVGRAGRQLFAEHGHGASVTFIRGAAETLPFSSGEFDLVICRLVLPYTDNARALKEFARVLRPGGALLLKIHHARYYMREFGQALMARRLLTMIHAARVLLAGAAYHLTGKQPRGYFPSRETFQTAWLLNREAESAGFRVQSRLPDANNLTPSFLIIKQSG